MPDDNHDDSYEGAAEALDELRDTLLGLEADRVTPFRMSVPVAVANVLAVARSFGEDRERMARAFTKEGFDPDRYANVKQRGLALWQADADYNLAIDPKRSLPKLASQAGPLRTKLLKSAIYLWEDHDAHGDAVDAIRAGSGYLDTADDLLRLASLFESEWDGVSDQSKVTREDLLQARRLGQAIIQATSAKADNRITDDARALKDRAAAYAQWAVDDIRNAAHFLYHGDDEKMSRYPSIFTGRGSGGGRPRKPEPNDGGNQPSS